MDEAENGMVVNNPHDGLFRKTWSDLENVRSFLQHYLPVDVLNLVDLDSLAICKDTFVEKELAAYYSDMLYAVTLAGAPGFVYVLFEHKSWYDKYVHLQLLEYMVKKEIKGTIMARVVLLLFKYSSDPNLMAKLPEILALMRELRQLKLFNLPITHQIW